MKRIEWRDDYCVGSPEIDQEHRHLVKLVGMFIDALNSGKGVRLIDVQLKALIQYTKTHFRHEEARLAKANCPRASDMIAKHRHLETRIGLIDKMVLTHSAQAVYVELGTWVFEELLPHFLIVDREAFTAAGSGRPAAAEAPSGRPLWARKRYLLRLLMSRISDLFVHKGGALPINFIEGMDRYLEKLLGAPLYERLNGTAQTLVDRFQGVSEDGLWSKTMATQDGEYFLSNLLVRMLLKFGDFAKSRKTFLNICNTALGKGEAPLSNLQFRAMFQRLFADVFTSLETEIERTTLDYKFGEGTAERILQIKDQFLKDGAA